jgi:hypothetical protein
MPAQGPTPHHERLPPEVLRDIDAWRDHPELASLRAALQAHASRKSFLDAYAEAVVARHLVKAGCDLRFEVPTPAGRQADFEVALGEAVFYLHVKRVDTERPVRRRLTVSSRLRYLERIPRPYVVNIRWHEHLADEQMQRLVLSASEFIRHARVGDELIVRDDEGHELGGVQIVAPWEGTHVSLAIGLPTGFVDEAPRIQKLMRKAYRQFMPRAVNVILIGTSHREDVDDFETALLGMHIERWDTFPPRGRRIAHGRDADGFWADRRHAESNAAGWFLIDERAPELTGRIWIRPGDALEPALADALGRLFPG